MKRFAAALTLAGWTALAAPAAETATASAPAAPAGAAAAAELGADAQPAPNAELRRQEIEFGARVAVLKDWSARLQKRAAEGPGNQAQWQTALAQELAAQAEKESEQMAALTRQRLAQEDKDPKLKAAGAPDPDVSAYAGKLETLLSGVEQDLAAALQDGLSLAGALQTNTSPDQVFVLSNQISYNRTLVRALERERTALELEKLRFRILSKR